MPSWLSDLSTKTILGILAALSLLGFLWYIHHTGYLSGISNYQVKQEKAQDKQDAKIESDYKKIDAATPFHAANDVSAKWLLNHAGKGAGAQ